jgi:hypothetical protein
MHWAIHEPKPSDFEADMVVGLSLILMMIMSMGWDYVSKLRSPKGIFLITQVI